MRSVLGFGQEESFDSGFEAHNPTMTLCRAEAYVTQVLSLMEVLMSGVAYTVTCDCAEHFMPGYHVLSTTQRKEVAAAAANVATTTADDDTNAASSAGATTGTEQVAAPVPGVKASAESEDTVLAAAAKASGTIATDATRTQHPRSGSVSSIASDVAGAAPAVCVGTALRGIEEYRRYQRYIAAYSEGKDGLRKVESVVDLLANAITCYGLGPAIHESLQHALHPEPAELHHQQQQQQQQLPEERARRLRSATESCSGTTTWVPLVLESWAKGLAMFPKSSGTGASNGSSNSKGGGRAGRIASGGNTALMKHLHDMSAACPRAPLLQLPLLELLVMASALSKVSCSTPDSFILTQRQQHISRYRQRQSQKAQQKGQTQQSEGDAVRQLGTLFRWLCVARLVQLLFASPGNLGPPPSQQSDPAESGVKGGGEEAAGQKVGVEKAVIERLAMDYPCIIDLLIAVFTGAFHAAQEAESRNSIAKNGASSSPKDTATASTASVSSAAAVQRNHQVVQERVLSMSASSLRSVLRHWLVFMRTAAHLLTRMPRFCRPLILSHPPATTSVSSSALSASGHCSQSMRSLEWLQAAEYNCASTGTGAACSADGGVEASSTSTRSDHLNAEIRLHLQLLNMQELLSPVEVSSSAELSSTSTSSAAQPLSVSTTLNVARFASIEAAVQRWVIDNARFISGHSDSANGGAVSSGHSTQVALYLPRYPVLTMRPQLLALPLEYTRLHAYIMNETIRALNPPAETQGDKVGIPGIPGIGSRGGDDGSGGMSMAALTVAAKSKGSGTGKGRGKGFDQPAMCLVCGAVLNAGGKGQCYAHTMQCGGETGIFFLLQVSV